MLVLLRSEALSFGAKGMQPNMSAALGIEAVSPVTLNDHWSRLARLILLASLATVGSIGNVFMISAVMIEGYLRKRGNTFIVNVALADLLVSGLVVSASAVVILAGLRDDLPVCRFQWFLAAMCFLVTVLSLTATAAENYSRLCCSASRNESLTSAKITGLTILFWITAATISGLQFVPDLSFDYCTRKHPGKLPYQATVFVLLVLFPILLTMFCYIKTFVEVKRSKARPSFKPPITFNWDCSLMQTNFYSFLLFLIFWIPFGVVLGISSVKPVPASYRINLAWLAISKSCINNILYCVANRHFRTAYINLFHYCCCKTTVSFSRRQRTGCLMPSGDVRVHIIPGYNMYCSPQRGREGPSKRLSTRLNGRDVYEL